MFIFRYNEIKAEVTTERNDNLDKMEKKRMKIYSGKCSEVESMGDFKNFVRTTAGINILQYNKLAATFSAQVVDDNRKGHVIVKDDFFVQEIAEAKTVHIFESCMIRPDLKDVKQMLIIMLREKDKVRAKDSTNEFSIIIVFIKIIIFVFPCIYTFLSDTDVESYNAVFQEIKDIFPNWQPSEIFCDYQENLVNSLNQNFSHSGSKILGSFNNFVQVMKRLFIKIFENAIMVLSRSQ